MPAVDMGRGAVKKRCYHCPGTFPHPEGMPGRQRGKYAALVANRDILQNAVALNCHKAASEVDMKCIMYQ